MYYLNSRFYDPAIGRFINADTIELVLASQCTLSDKNLYAYCDNNPVMRRDESGAAWETVFDVISLGASIADVAANPTNVWAWAGLAGDIADVAIPFIGGIGETIKCCGAVNKADNIIDVAKSGTKTTPGFEDWLNKGTSDNKVYFGIKKGEPQYTGITKQTLDTRLSQCHPSNYFILDSSH